MADVLHKADAPPPVPGFWRLGWLLFMQPLTLHRLFTAWGLENDPSFWKLRGRMRDGDPVVGAVVARLVGWLYLVTPVSAVVVSGGLDLAGLPVDWPRVAGFVAYGVAAGVAAGVAFGVAAGVAFGVAGGVALGVTAGVTAGVTGVLAVGVAGVLAGVAAGDVAGYVAGSSGVRHVLLPALSRLPLYPVELTLTGALHLAARLRPDSLPRLASYLPYRYHELIYLPLPFLSGFLVRLGEEHPAKGRRALAEAATSIGQKGPARRALVELQARSLERAARERRYASTAALALPFLPERENLAIGEFNSGRIGYLVAINSIAAAAQDLEAARSTGSHHQRRQALSRARRELEQTLYLLNSARPTRAERRFLPVVKQWLDRVDDEEAALARLERDQPQVPLVFVAGVPLTPMDESLFVGRRDLVSVLDQDLAAERPVPLVLLARLPRSRLKKAVGRGRKRRVRACKLLIPRRWVFPFGASSDENEAPGSLL